MDIPEHYLPQILADLVRQGLLVAVAGPDGGYALARDPKDVSLLAVVEAAEGPVNLESCLLRGGPCDWEHACPLHVPWTCAQDALIARLQATTFRELADTDSAIERGTYGERAAHRRNTVRSGVRGAEDTPAPPSPPPPPAPRRRPRRP